MASVNPRLRRGLQWALFLVAGIELAVAVIDLTAGGFSVRVLGLRLSSWEAYKPFRIGMIALVLGLWLQDEAAPEESIWWNRLARMAPWIAAAIAVAATMLAIMFRIRSAGGADAYGYVSQALSWTRGEILTVNPLVGVTREVGPAVAPLGYQLTKNDAWLAPVYAPGLPLLMAVAVTLGGAPAAYFVSPLMVGVAAWLTFLLARRVADARVALIACACFAFCPIALFQAEQPMSDVPVTACWLLAWLLAMSPARWAPFASGLAVSAALAIRPNLVIIAPVIAFVVALEPPRLRRLTLLAAGAAPACLAIAVLNSYLYGSPFQSGYGPTRSLYAWGNVGGNLRNYTSWLLDLCTPAVLLALLAPLVTRLKAAWSMLAFAVLLLGCYLFYFVFDSWPFLRFLLPALPMLLILSSGVMVRAIETMPAPLRGAALLLLLTLLPGWYLVKASDLNVFTAYRAEERYATVGGALGRVLEPNAVVLTVLHSGSIRFYAGRATVRWDIVEPDNLEFSLKALREGGFVPYVLIEDYEADAYRKRFSAGSRCGGLDWPARYTFRNALSGTVTNIYEVGDRLSPRACGGPTSAPPRG